MEVPSPMSSRSSTCGRTTSGFPRQLSLDGSDAMNPDPDYSAAYLQLVTDADDGLTGDGFVFTIGRGNDVQVYAVRAVAQLLVGRSVEELLGDLGGVWRELVHDSQLRWLGPEKGVMHMAVGAVVNALWDLRAKRAGLPLWQLLAASDPRGDRRPRRFPLFVRCSDPRAGTGPVASGRTGSTRARRPSCSPRASRRTPPPRAGSATTTRNWPGCAGRRSPTASPRSN